MSPQSCSRAEEAPNPLIPHAAELIVGAIAFLLLFFVLKKFVFPLFEKTYAERTEAIEGGIQRAEDAQAEAAARPRAVPGAARRRPWRGRRDPRRGPGRARPASSRRLGPRPRPRPRPSSPGHARRSRPTGCQARAELRAEVGTIAIDLAEQDRRRVA